MYENLVNNIDEIVRLINGSVTTYRTTLRLKNLKLEDAGKDIVSLRKDENVTNDQLYEKFLDEKKLKEELEKYKNDTKDYDNYIEFYDVLVERYNDKKKEYNKLLDKKNKLLEIKTKTKHEEERLNFQIEDLNKDLVYVISSIQELVNPFNDLKNKFNIKEEVKNQEKQDENKKNEISNVGEQEKSLDELADLMTIDEMNTILNMISSNNIDQSILDSIANRLGVDSSRLEEIAKYKEKKLKQQESVNDENYENKDVNGSNENDNQEEEKKVQVDTKPEPKKKPTKISQALEKLKSKIDKKALVALVAVAGTLALILANPALVLAAGAGYAYKYFSDGRKK